MPQLKIWQENVLSNIMRRILARDYYYSSQATRCTDLICASFLAFAASQKKHQISMFQKMAGLYITDFFAKSIIENRNHLDGVDNLSDKTLEELFNYVNKLSIRDLKMYIFLSHENKKSESIVSAFIDLEEDFLARIESGYLKHLSLEATEIVPKEAPNFMTTTYNQAIGRNN
jgi:hypothetical protein